MAKVGLLEDNARIAKMCAMMLHYAGHEVSIYEHPRECLRALMLVPDVLGTKQDLTSLGPASIDVLILDLHLPDMTGFEVIHLLHSQSHTKMIPLILCTAATATEISRAMCLAPGAALIEKPFNYQTLAFAINDALQVQRA
jgi:DNA-binding response OmpR family regulator